MNHTNTQIVTNIHRYVDIYTQKKLLVEYYY